MYATKQKEQREAEEDRHLKVVKREKEHYERVNKQIKEEIEAEEETIEKQLENHQKTAREIEGAWAPKPQNPKTPKPHKMEMMIR